MERAAEPTTALDGAGSDLRPPLRVLEGTSGYATVYEFASTAVPESPEWKGRGTDLPGRHGNAGAWHAPVLQIGRMSVPAEVDAEWNAWYSGEYVPGYRKG